MEQFTCRRGADGLAVCQRRRRSLGIWADGKTVRPTTATEIFSCGYCPDFSQLLKER